MPFSLQLHLTYTLYFDISTLCDDSHLHPWSLCMKNARCEFTGKAWSLYGDRRVTPPTSARAWNSPKDYVEESSEFFQIPEPRRKLGHGLF